MPRAEIEVHMSAESRPQKNTILTASYLHMPQPDATLSRQLARGVNAGLDVREIKAAPRQDASLDDAESPPHQLASTRLGKEAYSRPAVPDGRGTHPSP